MATKTFEELKQLAIQIRDEKTNKQNTATRIGTQMLEHLDKLEQDYYDKTATDEELKERDEKLTELEGEIEKSVSEEDVNVTNEADKYLFIDSKGNVIFEIDKNGPKACSYNIIDPSSKEIIGSINKDFFDKIKTTSNIDGLYPELEAKQFVFSDENGNIIAFIDENGINIGSVKIYDIKEKKIVGVIDKDFFDKINNIATEDIYPGLETDKFSFSDKFGREIAHIDKKGVTSASFFTKNGKNIGNSYIHPLFGKRVWGFGDSHCGVDNCKIWMQRLEEVTGCIIDYIENSRLGIRYTGDTTSSIFKKYEQYIDTNQKSLAALREEVDSGKQEEPDVIFLEQTHYVFDDEISNEPFVGSQIIEYNSEDSPFASSNAMDLAIEDNTIQSYIDMLQDKLSCTVLKMYYSLNSKVIAFTSSGNLHAGSFSLNIGDNVFSVDVSEGDTISQALTKLNEWVFSDNSDWANVNPHTEITTNKLTIKYIGSGSPQVDITVTDSGTGISLDNVSDSVSVDFKYLLFMSHNPSDWSNKDKWKLYDRNTNHYGYSIIKGMIELAQKLFPKTIFVLWYPNSLNLSNGVTNYADGSLNYYATRSNNYWSQEELKGRDAWKACAELYSCRFIDVSRNSNISLINYSSWYNSEIHPINAGYERWGDIIALLY